MSDVAGRARRTLFNTAARGLLRARAFEARHRELVDALLAAFVTILAMFGWGAAFALFAH